MFGIILGILANSWHSESADFVREQEPEKETFSLQVRAFMRICFSSKPFDLFMGCC